MIVPWLFISGVITIPCFWILVTFVGIQVEKRMPPDFPKGIPLPFLFKVALLPFALIPGCLVATILMVNGVI